MSKVLSKYRNLSKFQFYGNYISIMNRCYDYFSNLKKFNNGKFEIYSVPILQTISAIQQDIIIANGIYPINEHEVMIRRDWQNIAINKLEWCLNFIEFMMKREDIRIEKDGALKGIVMSIYDEIDHLKVWRKQNNSLMKKFRDLSTDNIGSIAASSKLAI